MKSPLLRSSLPPVLLLLGLLGLYAFTAPATVNGDGLGYLRQSLAEGLAPGHLAYLPVLRALARPLPPRAPLDLEGRARWLSILCAVASLALFFDGARRLRGGRPALFATALLGLSYGFFRSAQEVEVYATSALLATACLWSLLRALTGPPARAPWWAALAGLTCGLAVLFHLTLALLAPSLLALLWRLPEPRYRLRCFLLGGAALALAAGAPMLILLHRHGLLLRGPAAVWSFLRSADHGLPYPHTVFTPLVAVWGLCRSLVYVPYPYEASLLKVALLSAAGALAWAALLVRWWRRREQHPLSPAARTLLLAWIVPLAAFGVLFYPSDTERWIFLLPALALLVAPAADRTMVALVAGPGAAQSVHHRDSARPRRPRQSAGRCGRPARPPRRPGRLAGTWLGRAHRAAQRRPSASLHHDLLRRRGAKRRGRAAAPASRPSHGRPGEAGGSSWPDSMMTPTRAASRSSADWVCRGGATPPLFAPYRPRPTSAPGLWELSDLSASAAR